MEKRVFKVMILIVIFITTIYYRIIKNFYKMIRVHKEVKVAEQSRRFNAPYLKSLAGQQMVFSVQQEQDLYFKNLTVNW